MDINQYLFSPSLLFFLSQSSLSNFHYQSGQSLCYPYFRKLCELDVGCELNSLKKEEKILGSVLERQQVPTETQSWFWFDIHSLNFSHLTSRNLTNKNKTLAFGCNG